jgi:hypothetical protein
MTGAGASPFGTERAAQLRKHAMSAFRGSIVNLVRPQCEKSRQIARSDIGAGAGGGHGSENALGRGALALGSKGPMPAAILS